MVSALLTARLAVPGMEHGVSCARPWNRRDADRSERCDLQQSLLELCELVSSNVLRREPQVVTEESTGDGARLEAEQPTHQPAQEGTGCLILTSMTSAARFASGWKRVVRRRCVRRCRPTNFPMGGA